MGTPALDLLSRGMAFVQAAFGTTDFVVQGLGAVSGVWNDLGRTETVEINGKMISFSVLAEFPRALRPGFSDAQFQACAGKLVTRSSDGLVLRVTGEVQVDELTVRFALDSRHK
jgi:hypothetical protein